MDMLWKAAKWKATKKMIDREARRMLDRDVLLRRAGLETRTPMSDFFTGLGLFSVGVLVGAGLGLLFAPRRGEDVRAMMTDAWQRRSGRGSGPNYPAMSSETAPVPAVPSGR